MVRYFDEVHQQEEEMEFQIIAKSYSDAEVKVQKEIKEHFIGIVYMAKSDAVLIQ